MTLHKCGVTWRAMRTASNTLIQPLVTMHAGPCHVPHSRCKATFAMMDFGLAPAKSNKFWTGCARHNC